jgi:hypothetical protein
MATIATGHGRHGRSDGHNPPRAGHEVRAWNHGPDKVSRCATTASTCATIPHRGGGAVRAAGDAVLGIARRTSLAEGQIWCDLHHRDRGIEQCAALARGQRHPRRRAGARHRRRPRAPRGPGSAPTRRSTRSRRSSTRSGSGRCASGLWAPRRGSSSRSTCGSWP